MRSRLGLGRVDVLVGGLLGQLEHPDRGVRGGGSRGRPARRPDGGRRPSGDLDRGGRAAIGAAGGTSRQLVVLPVQAAELGLDLVEEGVDLVHLVALRELHGRELLVGHVRRRSAASGTPSEARVTVSGAQQGRGYAKDHEQFRQVTHDDDLVDQEEHEEGEVEADPAEPQRRHDATHEAHGGSVIVKTTSTRTSTKPRGV